MKKYYFGECGKEEYRPSISNVLLTKTVLNRLENVQTPELLAAINEMKHRGKAGSQEALLKLFK